MKYIAIHQSWFGGKEYTGQPMFTEAGSITEACAKFGAAETIMAGQRFERPFDGSLYIVHPVNDDGSYDFSTERAIRVVHGGASEEEA